MNPLTVPPKKEKVQNLLISTVCGVVEFRNRRVLSLQMLKLGAVTWRG